MFNVNGKKGMFIDTAIVLAVCTALVGWGAVLAD